MDQLLKVLAAIAIGVYIADPVRKHIPILDPAESQTAEGA